MRIHAVLALCLAMAACDPVQRISSNASEIRDEAQALISRGQETGDHAVVDGARRIDELAAGIHDEIPGVTNKVPEWLSTLKWWGIALAVMAVAFVLWNSGALTAVRIAVGWIPRPKVRDAELAAAMLDDCKQENPREYVAARRAADPAFDAAWRKIKKETP